MEVNITVFAALKTYFENEFKLEVNEQASIAELVERLMVLNPLAQPVISRCRFAIDNNFVSPNYVLNHEERVCVIPPSSGG